MYPPGSSVPISKEVQPIDPGAPVPGGTTSSDPLIVIAPENQQQQEVSLNFIQAVQVNNAKGEPMTKVKSGLNVAEGLKRIRYFGFLEDKDGLACGDDRIIATDCAPYVFKQQDEGCRDGKRLKLSYEAYGEVTSAKRYAETDWKQQQKREKTRIMHLRPPGCSYLPVYIMHEAFDEMARIIEREEDFEAEDFALLDALLDALLSEMGKGFDRRGTPR